MDRLRSSLMIAVVAPAVLLTGCATSSGSSAGGSPTATTTASTGSTTPAVPAPSASTPVGSTPIPGQSLSLSGTVVQGAEPSCLILQTPTGMYELLGDTDGVHPGDTLDVTGTVVHVMSHCMQGRPFQVTHLTKH